MRSGELNSLTIIFLCAQWCDVCRAFSVLLQNHKNQHTDFSYVWIDIEEQADRVDPIEINDFPTLLLLKNNAPIFFGSVRPELTSIIQLIETCRHDQFSALKKEDIQPLQELADRLFSSST
jgi:thioredoxin 1